jgi:hypothetical protein
MFTPAFLTLIQLVACRSPFDGDRHQLEGFRIAALSASAAETGTLVEVSAAIVSEGHLWHDTPVELAWYWLDHPDEIDARDPAEHPPDGLGAHPTLMVPAHTRILGLIAQREDTYRAVFELPEGGAEIPAFHIHSDTQPVDPKASTRLTVTLDTEADREVHARWMATEGTFAEQSALETDWKAPKAPGTATVLALLLDDVGSTRWTLTDLHVGDPEAGVWSDERWFPSDIEVAPGRYDVLFSPDDEAPAGVRLTQADPPTNAALPCAPNPIEPFSAHWLTDGSCARSEVVGVPVTLEIQ